MREKLSQIRNLGLLLSAVLLAAPSALLADEGWVQIRTPNFLEAIAQPSARRS